jgi:hypothetical protein
LFQRFTGTKTDGLPINSECAGGDDIEVGTTIVDDGSGHDRTSGIAGANNKK